MPDYKLGKIYKIYCNVTGEVYVGSTTEKTLARRLASHVGHYKRFSNGIKTPAVASFNIIGRGDYFIDLLENCPCDNRDELIKKEREWYDKIDCINKIRPYRSPEEKKEDRRNWYLENRDYEIEKAKLRCKTQRENNKEEVNEKKRIHYQNNKEHCQELNRLSYKRQKEKGFTEEQKAKINKNSLNNYYNHQEDYNKKAIERYKEKSQEKETCDICGRTYLITSRKFHLKTDIHKASIKDCDNNNNNV